MANQGNGADMAWANFSGTSKLNGDMLIQILLRLPVLSILRFKSVCKEWNNLFSSSKFIQHHFRLANSSAPITNLLSLDNHAKQTSSDDLFSELWKMPPDFVLLGDFSCENPVVITLNPPFGGDLVDVKVVGSVNGLVCLDLYDNATSFLLWNPATKKYSRIPNPRLSLASDERFSSGFAYDENTDSYKVIRILYPKVSGTKKVPIKVEIYSTETNTWRTKEFDDFRWLLDKKTCGAVVNGSPYWYGYILKTTSPVGPAQNPFSQQAILWFDPSVEDFGVLKLRPIPIGDTWGRDLGLGSMGGHPVAFICCRRPVFNAFKWNREVGSGIFTTRFEVLKIEPISFPVTILGIARNGVIIALDSDGNPLTYDPRSKEIKYLPDFGYSGWTHKVYDYTETLVSPSRPGLLDIVDCSRSLPHSEDWIF